MDPIPFRLRLGLIGHRHLDSPELVAQAVRDLLRGRLLTDLALEPSPPRKTPILLAAVTNLADGADRVLAKVVLEQPGATLDVILPFAVVPYRDTMLDKQDFDDMLAKDRSPRALRQEIQPADEESRQLAYRDGARELLNNCDVLIAVWNGEPAKGPGGTGETVAIAGKRKRPLYIVSPDGKVVFEQGQGFDQRPLEGIEAFNNAREPDSQFLKAVEGSELTFLQPPNCEPVPQPHRQAIQSILFPAYLRASALAHKNQEVFFWATRLLCILAPLSVLCVAAAVTFGRDFERPLILGEAFLLAIVALLVWRTASGKYQEKWMTNRFLAERLRGAFFLAACGLDPLPIDVPPHLGLAHRPGDWPVRAFNEIWLRMPSLVRCEGSCGDLVAFVGQHWIEDQIAFHESRAHRWGGRSQALELTGNFLFALTLLAALAHLGVPKAHEDWSHLLEVLAIACPAYGASLAAYRGYRGFERLEKRSDQMVESLKDLHQRLATVGTASQLQQRMREMENLSLRETQDWLMLVRFTHLEAA